MTAKLAETYPIQVICEALDLPRSTYYYHTQAEDDQQVRLAIEEVAQRWPTYGYRRMAQQLRREKDWIINDKRVRCLMKKMGLQAKSGARPTASKVLPGIRTLCLIWKSSGRSKSG